MVGEKSLKRALGSVESSQVVLSHGRFPDTTSTQCNFHLISDSCLGRVTCHLEAVSRLESEVGGINWL